MPTALSGWLMCGTFIRVSFTSFSVLNYESDLTISFDSLSIITYFLSLNLISGKTTAAYGVLLKLLTLSRLFPIYKFRPPIIFPAI